MIIPDSFKEAYNTHHAIVETIKEEADGILRQIAHRFPGVVYYSRIKSLESVFIKTLLGNYETPFSEMEDFFACTLVSPTLSFIPSIRDEVSIHFNVHDIEQKTPNPYEFQYNDLHLLLTFKDTPMRSEKSVLDRRFELQIKTLLQSAWSQAGHDIVYKPLKISWGSDRIAGQLRALLELADSVLAQIEATAQLLQTQTEKTYSDYKGDTRRIIEIMERHWSADNLPSERRRMAQIVNKYLQIAGITPDEFGSLIQSARDQDHSVFDYLTLPPMQQIFILIFQNYRDQVQSKLNSGRHRVLITHEMEDFFPELQEIKTGKINYHEM